MMNWWCLTSDGRSGVGGRGGEGHFTYGGCSTICWAMFITGHVLQDNNMTFVPLSESVTDLLSHIKVETFFADKQSQVTCM